MAISRRGDRKERKSALATAPPGENGSHNGSNTGTAQDVRPAARLDREATERLAHALIERNLVNQSQVDEVLTSDATGSDLGDLLVTRGMLDEHALTTARSDISGLPIIDLGMASPEAEALALIPDSMAREHYVIPMTADEAGLIVAVVDKPSPELMNLLSQTAETTIRPMLAPFSEIRRAIDNNYRAIGGLDHLVQAFEAVEETRKRPVSGGGTEESVTDDDAPVVQVVGRILTQAMRDRASDVHLEPRKGAFVSATASTAHSKRS